MAAEDRDLWIHASPTGRIVTIGQAWCDGRNGRSPTAILRRSHGTVHGAAAPHRQRRRRAHRPRRRGRAAPRRWGLTGGYRLGVSTGAQRATQTLACFLAALGQPVPGGVIVEAGLRSQREERWRAAYHRGGSGELEALRVADPELVADDSAALGAALGRVLERLGEGERALIVGHSPTNEAAVLGLTGQVMA